MVKINNSRTKLFLRRSSGIGRVLTTERLWVQFLLVRIKSWNVNRTNHFIGIKVDEWGINTYTKELFEKLF